MPIRAAHINDLNTIRQLIRRGRHVYTNFGSEDLASFVRQGASVLGIDNGRPWGVLCIELEQRPETLPVHAPSRAFLRSLVLTHGRSPLLDVARLLDAATVCIQTGQKAHLTTQAAQAVPAVQLVYFATASWLIKPLQAAGFRIVERVEFLHLDRLQRRTVDTSALVPVAARLPVQLRSAQTADLDALAQLDAETFAPRWHFSSKQMLELLLASRVQVAVQGGPQQGAQAATLVGYSALSIKPHLVSEGVNEAQLARLAVHPRVQGSGLGRLLMADSVRYAQQQGIDSIVLNTQTDNRRAQKLYRSFGFRSTGQITPVLTKSVGLT